MNAKLLGALLGVALFVATVFAVQTPVDGDVWSIQSGTTLHWLRASLDGKVGTQILTDGKGNYLFVWSMQERGTGFTMLSENAKSVTDWVSSTGGKGNLANFTSAKKMLDFLKDNGWKVIPGSQVPHLIRIAVQAGGAVLAQYGQNMVSFFVFPAGTDWRAIPGLEDGEVMQ